MRRAHRNLQIRLRADGVAEEVEEFEVVEPVDAELQAAIDAIEKEHQEAVANFEKSRLEKLRGLGVHVSE